MSTKKAQIGNGTFNLFSQTSHLSYLNPENDLAGNILFHVTNYKKAAIVTYIASGSIYSNHLMREERDKIFGCLGG